MHQRGVDREYHVIDDFIAHGFFYAKAHRSGQAISEHRANARIPGDVFVFRDQGPAFQIEVGGANKRVDAEILEMRARLLPGFQPLVILYRNGAVRSADVTFYLSRSRKFATIDALIEGAGAHA